MTAIIAAASPTPSESAVAAAVVPATKAAHHAAAAAATIARRRRVEVRAQRDGELFTRQRHDAVTAAVSTGLVRPGVDRLGAVVVRQLVLVERDRSLVFAGTPRRASVLVVLGQLVVELQVCRVVARQVEDAVGREVDDTGGR